MKKKIDRFVIQDVLSEGGGSSVYKAKEELPGGLFRAVALKVLPVFHESDVKAQERFLAQVQLIVSLAGHPNIVTVYAMGLTERYPWLAMELLPTTLSQAIREQPAPAEHVEDVMRQVAAALSALHRLNPPILHNDLTPSNILINDFGGYKVADFSLAGPAALERTRVLATVRYAAPELLSREFGSLSPATDLYALGHIVYELALGGKLYRQQFPAVYDSKSASHEGAIPRWMAWHCSLETRPAAVHEVRPDFPPHLGMAIAKLMRKASAERYQTAAALLADLRGAPAGAPTPAAAQAPAAVQTPRAPTASALPLPPLSPPPKGPIPLTPSANEQTNERYYVRLGPQTSGPFDIAALKRLAQMGKVSRLHKVSTDRIAWKSISTVEGLF